MRHEIAAGTVTGKDHRLAGRNNQDAYHFAYDPDFDLWAGAVCDGCGSGAHSEVGAQLGARLLVDAMLTFSAAFLREAGYLDIVRRTVLDNLGLIARRMGGGLTGTVNEFLLFTAIVALIGKERSVFAAIGDGVVVVNGNVHSLGPFPGNAPPYLAYGFVPVEGDQDPERFKFRTVADIATTELDSFLIGTDGVDHLIQAADRPIPGKTESVGGLAQFWTEDRFYKNPFNVGRRLALVNRDTKEAHGHLQDDTTFIVGRATRQEEDADA